MRQGRVFKRCTRCGAKVAGKRCDATVDGARCNGSFTWAFVVDVAPKGASRRDQRRGSGYATMDAAREAMNRLQQQRVEGTYVEPSRQTVSEYLTTWVAAGCGGELRPWTRRGYESVVRNHIIPRIGDVPLQQLTREQIRAMYRDVRIGGYAKGRSPERVDHLQHVATRYLSLQGAGAGRATIRTLVAELGAPESTVRYWVRRCRELGLLDRREQVPMRPGAAPIGKRTSAKTVHNIHIALRAALNDAVDARVLRSNAARGALDPPKRRKAMKTWTVEELRAFLESIKDERTFALYRLAAQSGMRRGELLGLRWSDVKFSSNSLSVQQQWTGLEDDDEDFEDLEDLSPTKSDAGRRAISLDRATIDALHQHRAAQEFERRSWHTAYQDNDLVFCRPDGSPFPPGSVTDEFEKFIAQIQARRIRLHDLRHTHATLLLEAGVDITVVSRRLGHASVKTTADLYAHVTARLQEDAATRIGALVDGNQAPQNQPAPELADAIEGALGI